MSQKVRKYLISLLSMVNVSILNPKKDDILLIVFIRLFLVKHGKDLFKVAIRWCHKIHEYLFKQISKVLIYAAENTQWQHALIYVKW